MSILQQDHALACRILAWVDNQCGLVAPHSKRDEIELTKLIRQTHCPKRRAA